jgi:2-polyprenyl-6-methoxyphenol hydroxylase-like FAD-dependent oxidoreductase
VTTNQVDVLIVGAGPAGLVAAALLARAGRSVLVVERNDDFDREFRGEILQPRFHKAMQDVGLHEPIARWPHERVEAAQICFAGRDIGRLPLARIDARTETTWWMTQPNLLSALHEHASTFDGYELWFGARIEALDGSTATVARGGETVTVAARVVLGADGRFSAVRRLGGFELAYDHHDVDVLWFTLPRPPGYEHVFSFFLGYGHAHLVLPKHPDRLQCALVARPGEYHELHRRGIDIVRRELAGAHPLFVDFAAGLRDFSAFTYLKGNRSLVREWAKDGVLLMGDAAHTCSPVGGIGVAIAVETAIVAAGVVADCFAKHDFSRAAFAEVQRARRRQVAEVHRIQGNARLLVRSPAFVRWLAQLGLRTASLLGVLPFAARRLLAQRGPLPVNGLMP